MFRAMYWPLIGGFIAFVLVAILIGWIMDPSRHGGDTNHDGH
jgi:ABC-type Mn2+/Zn2+ transport system permease subunit